MKILAWAANQLTASLWRNAFIDDDEIEVIAPDNGLLDAEPGPEKVDLILVDVTGRVQQGIPLIQKFAQADPEPPVIVVGVPPEEHIVLAYIEAGCSGFIDQDSTFEEVQETLLAAQRKEAIIDPDVIPSIVERLRILNRFCPEPADIQRRLNTLTPREMDVLALIAEQMTNHEISGELVIEVGTVKNHVHSILNKLECDSRYEAAEYYLSGLGDRV